MRLSEARFEKFALLNYLYAMLDMAAVYTLHIAFAYEMLHMRCDDMCGLRGSVKL